MTTSFPFLAIARRFGVPYYGVLAIAIMHARYALLHPEASWEGHRDDGTVQSAIYMAFVAELARRQAIYAAAGS